MLLVTGAGVYWLAVFAGLTACHSTFKTEPSPAAMAHGEATARLGVRLDSTKVEIDKADSHVDPIGREHLATAREILTVAKATDLHEIIVTMAAREKEFAQNMAIETRRADDAEKRADWSDAKLAGVESTWYVRWGRRVETWLRWAAIAAASVGAIYAITYVAVPLLMVSYPGLANVLNNVHHVAGFFVSLGWTLIATGRARLMSHASNRAKSKKIEKLEAMGAHPAIARAAVLNRFKGAVSAKPAFGASS